MRSVAAVFARLLRGELSGRDAVGAFARKFRAAFPDLNFWGTADLIAEGDYVVGQWEGGGTHTGDAFDDMPYGPLPASAGKISGPPGHSPARAPRQCGLLSEARPRRPQGTFPGGEGKRRCRRGCRRAWLATGAAADGGTWTVCNGSLQVAPRDRDAAT